MTIASTTPAAQSDDPVLDELIGTATNTALLPEPDAHAYDDIATGDADPLVLGGHKFTSRFILGSGRYDLNLIKATIENAGTQIVTMALRRCRTTENNLLDYIPKGITMLPNMFPDPIAAKRLEEAGAACVMPLGSLIGSNKGLRMRDFIEVIIANTHVPVIIDAGIGRPSQAAEAMEMGADAVMAYTAIASAGNIPLMARAFKHAIESGREAYLSGLGTVTEGHAVPSSPTNAADYLH